MERRTILKAGTASLALASNTFQSWQSQVYATGNEKPLRVGLIGCGWNGKCDLFRLLQVSPVEVVSLCDVDKLMLKEAAEMTALRQLSKKTPRTFSDYREMSRKEISTWYSSPRPHHWHALPILQLVKRELTYTCKSRLVSISPKGLPWCRSQKTWPCGASRHTTPQHTPFD